MNKRAVEQYIKNNNLFKKFEVKKLGRGNNSNVFVVKASKKKYTFRVGKKGFILENRYKEHWLALKFLEHAGISFAPRPVHFDLKEDVLITTYVPGKPITDTGLNSKQLELLVRQLVKLNSIKHSDYLKFLKKEKIEVAPLPTPLDAIQKFGVKRYRKLQKISSDKKVVDWIAPRLKANIAYIKAQQWSNKDLIFTHGDLTGANILAYKNKLFFIDWDRAKFGYNLNRGLSHMFNHFIFFNLKKDEIIKLYARFAKMDIKKLQARVLMAVKVGKINDVIWAATMYSELYAEKKRGWKKYYKMTYKRIKEFEKLI